MLKAPVSIVALLLLAAALACAAPPPTPIPTATPDIPATVTAQVAAIPTATAYPTNTPYPTATPRPTVTPYPTATPRPTYTLYPTPTAVPTATPYPTSTPYPTATSYPTYTPYPTPTPTPTPTPRPTATPVPPIQWRTQRPRSYYSIDVPADWQKSFDDEDTDSSYVVFRSPSSRTASVAVFYAFSEYGWVDGTTVDDVALGNLNATDDEPGFRILSLWSVSSTVKRSSYRYNGQAGHCDISGYGLHILLPQRNFFVRIEICDNSRRKYDDAFVDRMFNSFTYRER